VPGEKVFGFRLEAARTKIRYGRAVLTVQRSGAVIFTPIAEMLEVYRQGRAAIDDVAWAFLKTRVVAHSPSFDWSNADIDRLLPRVTAVCRDPRIEAASPAALVPELEELLQRDLEELDADRRRFAEVRTILPGMSELDLSELSTGKVKLSREDGSRVSDATQDWRQIERSIQGLFRAETVLDPTAFYEAIAKLLDSDSFATLSTATGFTFSATMPAEVWPELEMLISQVDDPTLAAVIRHGMEALEKAETISPELALKELTEAITSLQTAVEKIGDSPQKTILLGVAGGLITLLLQAALAKAGVKL